jgi:hypothetical protein
MPQKEDEKFTGFVAYYDNGNTVKERNNYLCAKTSNVKSTNWSEIDKERLVALELFWNGESKIKIDKIRYPDLKPSDWYFSHLGSLDMNSHKTIVVSRNIGFIKDELLTVFCVQEQSGVVKIDNRPKP